MEGKAIFKNSNVFLCYDNFLKTLKIFFAKIPFSANCHQTTYFLWTLEENEYTGIKYPMNVKWSTPKKYLYWWRYWLKESRNSLDSTFFFFFFFFCAFKMPLFKLKSPGFLSKIYTLFRFSKIQVDKPD